jgi:hypothetical protein
MLSGSLGGFVLSPQAAGAQVEFLFLAVNNNRRSVNIRLPGPVGMPLGMAYIVTELG